MDAWQQKRKGEFAAATKKDSAPRIGNGHAPQLIDHRASNEWHVAGQENQAISRGHFQSAINAPERSATADKIGALRSNLQASGANCFLDQAEHRATPNAKPG